ncbi:protein rnfH [Salinisphaera sp. PC39]|uniref:RnfH family protein n=1 Tax=Salinisphaera sp. PC39 TaxID=1304156 RepID=UPI00333FF7C7
MRVEVAYARPEGQTLLTLDLPPGSSVAEAVTASGVLERHPEIDWPGTPVGIFGRKVSPERLLREGDRVEIYRPLTIDPKEARRRRAAARDTQGGL